MEKILIAPNGEEWQVEPGLHPDVRMVPVIAGKPVPRAAYCIHRDELKALVIDHNYRIVEPNPELKARLDAGHQCQWTASGGAIWWRWLPDGSLAWLVKEAPKLERTVETALTEFAGAYRVGS